MCVCVCASSSLLQVHLCPLYPFLLFHLSSWFLPPEQPMLHFSWIILSIPVLGSGWLLIASPLPSISLASFGFNIFFKRISSSLCCLILSLNSFNTPHEDPEFSPLCSSPFPVSCSAALRICCYAEGFGVDVTDKYHTMPCLVLLVKDQGPVAALWLCCLGLPWSNRFFGRALLRASQRTARLCRLSGLSTSFIPWLRVPWARLSLRMGIQRGKKSISVLSQSSSGRGTFPASWRLR